MDAAQSDGYAAAIAVANSWWTRPKQGGGLAVAQCSRALQLAADAVSPAAAARFHALIAAASPQSLGCPGVHLRLPNESAATLCSTPSRRLEDGRRAAPDGSNRSSSRRRRAFTSSPSGGSAGFLPRAAPESFSTRDSHTKRCAGQDISRRRCPTSRPPNSARTPGQSLACRCSPHSQSFVWHA